MTEFHISQKIILTIVFAFFLTVFIISILGWIDKEAQPQWQEKWECVEKGTITKCIHTGETYADCHTKNYCFKQQKMRELVE